MTLRRFISTTSLTCLLTAGFALPATAEELVVATFGGTFVENSKKCHAAAFEKVDDAEHHQYDRDAHDDAVDHRSTPCLILASSNTRVADW